MFHVWHNSANFRHKGSFSTKTIYSFLCDCLFAQIGAKHDTDFCLSTLPFPVFACSSFQQWHCLSFFTIYETRTVILVITWWKLILWPSFINGPLSPPIFGLTNFCQRFIIPFFFFTLSPMLMFSFLLLVIPSHANIYPRCDARPDKTDCQTCSMWFEEGDC